MMNYATMPNFGLGGLLVGEGVVADGDFDDAVIVKIGERKEKGVIFIVTIEDSAVIHGDNIGGVAGVAGRVVVFLELGGEVVAGAVRFDMVDLFEGDRGDFFEGRGNSGGGINFNDHGVYDADTAETDEADGDKDSSETKERDDTGL